MERALDDARQSAAATWNALLTRVGSDLAHPDAVALVAAADSPACRRELQDWVERACAASGELTPERALELADVLAERGLLEAACALAAQPTIASDRRLAHRRATWSMQLGRHEDALVAADSAISSELHAGLTLDDLVRLSLRGAPLESLMRHERESVVRARRLHEPLAIRWAALRQLERRVEAHHMRLLCLRHFPERASVWSSAGDQALDDGDDALAESYFDRCLALDRKWIAALAGKAIVCERRKDWVRALAYRERVVENTGALACADAPSMQRTVRYAAALSRVGRWREAGVLFRRAFGRGAYACLPAERPVFLRVFSRELYAPALIATCLAQDSTSHDRGDSAIALALHEASIVGRLGAQLSAAPRLVRGMAAWLVGDDERAYAWLDEAEESEGDLATQYLLLCCAQNIGAGELPSIAAFAERAARAALDSTPDDESALYALAILARVEGRAPEPPQPMAADGSIAHASASAGCPELAAGTGPWDVQLRRIVAFRAAQQTVGRAPLMAAAASSLALSALCE